MHRPPGKQPRKEQNETQEPAERKNPAQETNKGSHSRPKEQTGTPAAQDPPAPDTLEQVIENDGWRRNNNADPEQGRHRGEKQKREGRNAYRLIGIIYADTRRRRRSQRRHTSAGKLHKPSTGKHRIRTWKMLDGEEEAIKSEDSEKNANDRSSNNGAKERQTKPREPHIARRKQQKQQTSHREKGQEETEKRKTEETPPTEPCENLRKRQRRQDKTTEIEESRHPGPRAKKAKGNTEEPHERPRRNTRSVEI